MFIVPWEVKWDSSIPWRTRAANLNLHSDFDIPNKPSSWFSKRKPWYNIRQWMDGRPGQHALGDLWKVKQADKTQKYFSCVYQHNSISQWSSRSNCDSLSDTMHAWATGSAFWGFIFKTGIKFPKFSWRGRSCFHSYRSLLFITTSFLNLQNIT